MNTNMKSMSPRANKIIKDAQEEGRRHGSSEILPEHVLVSLLKFPDALGYILLRELGINISNFQLELEKSLPISGVSLPNPFSEIPYSRRLVNIIDAADIESRNLRNDYIGTEHIILSAFLEEGSIANRFFHGLGVTVDILRGSVRRIQSHFSSSASSGEEFLGQTLQQLFGSNATVIGISSSQRKRQESNGKQSFLDLYSRDLTALARESKMDAVIGRTKEINRTVQILSRRTKNNTILIGEPGVGKTAVVEGLAQKIASGEVPYNLMKKRILSLDLTALVAGTKYRGEFEDRMKRLIHDIKEDGNIIIFIDELHMLIGAGAPEGTMDASNILKPALSRGEIQIIGATTVKEYKKYFEKDSALARRFQPVSVFEPGAEDTEKILEGIKGKYEEFHGVIYDEGVIPAVVKMSSRYIQDRFLPDKAIDVLDEAGSLKKIQEEFKPQELLDLEQQIEALAEEKKSLVAYQQYEKAALVRDKVLDLKQKCSMFREYWQSNPNLTKKHVTVDDVCKVVSSMTGIPLEQIDSNESRRLLDMEKALEKTVIGQEKAVSVLSNAVRRSRAGISSGDRPMGSFIFLGPTGVGKTQLAKSLAEFLFGSKDSIIRVDMSDYMEKHNASRLVGAPPGYVGFDDGGILTEKVRQKPYSVVLFDEIEKAHPDVFNLLLQLLEEGELYDGAGHSVNFRNTVIIMTSNAGVRQISSERRLGFSSIEKGILSGEEIKSNALEELRKIMSPELLNRIDDIVVFNALGEKEISQILDIQLKDLEKRLSEKKISLVLKPKARNYLMEKGFDPAMGARPLRRLLQNEIEEQLAILILKEQNGSSTAPRKASVDLVKGKIFIKFLDKNDDESESSAADAESENKNVIEGEKGTSGGEHTDELYNSGVLVENGLI